MHFPLSLHIFEARWDGTGRRGSEASLVHIVGLQRRHAAVKHEQQQTHSHPPGVIQTPTGLVTTAHQTHKAGVAGMVHKGSGEAAKECLP